ncbi:hypothetical protein ACQUW5_08795 [Legionella sp. CNM-1927-20]|uniref:hypothetical protein n=1 Tax=Legionella sp. CNM-1927-20 TaxID=3422221 RepID=UPI00403AB09E
MSNNQPIYSIQTLKKQAKLYAKEKQISLHQALDYVANQVGFTHWTLLIKHYSNYSLVNIAQIFSMLKPGHLMLVCADKNIGKMSFAMNLMAEASDKNIKSTYYSFHASREVILNRIKLIFRKNKQELDEQLIQIRFPAANYGTISADFNSLPENNFIIIDYLQRIPLNGINQFTLEMSQLAKRKRSRILALSQILPNEQRMQTFYRHFNHIIFLENTVTKEDSSKRNCSLIKSTHYQIQQRVLNFDRIFYKFE